MDRIPKSHKRGGSGFWEPMMTVETLKPETFPSCEKSAFRPEDWYLGCRHCY